MACREFDFGKVEFVDFDDFGEVQRFLALELMKAFELEQPDRELQIMKKYLSKLS